jgi:hypothetical protein
MPPPRRGDKLARNFFSSQINHFPLCSAAIFAAIDYFMGREVGALIGFQPTARRNPRGSPSQR